MAEEGYFLLNTDGGMDSSGRRSPGDPAGEAAIGVVLKRINKNNDKEVLIESFGRKIGMKSKDVAEYQALIEGLRAAIKHEATHVRAFMDAEYIVEQVNNRRPPNGPELRPLYEEVQGLIASFTPGMGFRLSWIPRTRNQEADELASKAR